jgi:hypothetical protein
MVRRERLLLVVAGAVALLAALYAWLQAQSPATTVAAGTPAAAPAGPDVPRIALNRLSHPPSPVTIGRRDVFDFASIEAPIEEGGGRPAPPPTTVAVAPVPTPVPTPAGPPPPPPVNVKYIGSVEAEKGPKVAFFLTEQKEVLTGQVGDTVMNRFKVVRIGIESVDVQELGSGQVRRIPLRGN